MSDEPDYYTILGVPPDAGAEQLKAARRARLREFHPDMNQQDPQAAARFMEIYKICEVLCDPVRRELYDQGLSSATTGTAAAGRDTGRVRCDACAGSGAFDFVKCGECQGLGRQGMGFSPTCWRCGGHGRLPVKCFRCEGRGWNERRPRPPTPRDASGTRSGSGSGSGSGTRTGSGSGSGTGAGAGTRANRGSRSAADPGAGARRRTPQSPPTCYEILGVLPDAAPDLITERYGQLLRRHLARIRGEPAGAAVGGAEEGAEASAVVDIDAVERAYRRVGSARRRAGYDRTIGQRPSRGVQGEVEIHVSRRCAREGDASHTVQVTDAEICSTCRGLGRRHVPCPDCHGRARRSGRGDEECGICGGFGGKAVDCLSCDRSGWTEVIRELACRVPAGARDGDLITAHDELMGTFDLRLRLALIPSFARPHRHRA